MYKAESANRANALFNEENINGTKLPYLFLLILAYTTGVWM